MEQEYFNTNQALWDQKTEYHKNSDFYKLEAFKEGKTSLMQPELDLMGDVSNKSLLHLQCHFGQDTLSFARMGAKATGIDLSTKSIELAQSLNEELGLDAQFVQSNVLELKDNLEGQFDIVFTSYGTTIWLPELKRWAAVIQHFLKPGGIFYIVDFHPTFYIFDHESDKISYNYFNGNKVYMEENEGTYADHEAPIKHREYFWSHSLHEIMGPLLNEGLQLLDFQEYNYSPYLCFQNMYEDAKGQYKYGPKDVNFPHLFSLKMQKPH